MVQETQTSFRKKLVLATWDNFIEELLQEQRPDYDNYFMMITDVIGLRATCNRGKSGSILVKDNKIIATGYVGSPPGLPHCDKAGHLMETVIHEDGLQSDHCVRTLHAEENAILQCAEFGISAKGATLYCKMVPCFRCAMKISRVGIIKVIAKKRYHVDKRTINMFNEKKIELVVLNDEVEEY